jgi:hypothetical protein
MMAGGVRARRGAPEPSIDSVAVSQRYVIVIGGTRIRTIGGDAADMTFRRWSQSPDVVMRGDLRTGFSWEWPDSKRTRIEIVPERDRGSRGCEDSPAVPADGDASRSRPGVAMA